MIIALINGKKAIPSTSSDIKIVLDNPYIKKAEEKTMEIVFPLDIPENRLVFGPLNRLDTSFDIPEYDDCRLIADNIVVIHGVGTVTSVTNTEIKLQILQGKSLLNFKESYDHIFIDAISYGGLDDKHQRIGQVYVFGNKNKWSVDGEAHTQGYIGSPGKYAFLPIYDENTDAYCNTMGYVWAEGNKNHFAQVLLNPAVQPNLIYVLKTVLKSIGYTVNSCFFDKAPWNNIYVANAKITRNLSQALPHWSVYKFLEEIRKLFNAVFLFDEENHTVDIVEFERNSYSRQVKVTAVDEFQSSYDDDGLEYLGSSNLQYALSNCERTADVISEEVKENFEIREFDSLDALNTAFQKMTEQQKRTVLMKCPTGWYYGYKKENGSFAVKGCGWFSPLVRRSGANTIDLNIVPVAIVHDEIKVYDVYGWDAVSRITGESGYALLVNTEWIGSGFIAHASVSSQANIDYFGYKAEEEDVEYTTLEDVLVNGESIPAKESDDVQLEIFFAGGTREPISSFEEGEHISIFSHRKPEGVRFPVSYTDYRLASQYINNIDKNSLSLNPSEGLVSIGDCHNKGLAIRRNVNGNNELSIPFLFDGKPDAKWIYLIRNKRYLCSKIEMAIADGVIARIKQGYFYEILTEGDDNSNSNNGNNDVIDDEPTILDPDLPLEPDQPVLDPDA